MKLNTAMRDALAATAITLNAGATSLVQVYSGTAPASANDAATGDKLWEVDVVGNHSETTGVASITNTPFAADALATGTAGYSRFTDGTCVIQLGVGLTGAEVNMSSLDFTTGISVSLNSMTITQPAT